jgi:hypothetical protein
MTKKEKRRSLTKCNSERLLKKYQSGSLKKTELMMAEEILSDRGVSYRKRR